MINRKKIHGTVLVFLFLCSGISAQEKKELNLEKISDDMKFLNGVQFIKLNKYDQAINEFNEYLEIYYNGIHRHEAYRHIAEVYLEKFEYQLAIKTFKRLYEEFSNTEDGVYAYFQIGICYKKMGYEKRAGKIFRSIINDHPESVYAHQAKIQIDLLNVLLSK